MSILHCQGLDTGKRYVANYTWPRRHDCQSRFFIVSQEHVQALLHALRILKHNIVFKKHKRKATNNVQFNVFFTYCEKWCHLYARLLLYEFNDRILKLIAIQYRVFVGTGRTFVHSCCLDRFLSTFEPSFLF